MALGKSVRMYLADGTPGGLMTAEIMNWTGHITAAPRSELGVLLSRQEVSRTGIYLLLGDDPDSPGDVLAYIGEGDDVGKRLTLHGRADTAGGKDFWNRAVVLTSKDMNLTKAHARYLESRFISIAHEARRATLINGTAPPPIQLPEADVSDMEYYIEQAKIVLPVLGVNLLRSTRTAERTSVADTAPVPDESPVFVLTSKRAGVEAYAQEVDGEFTVREGSRARLSWVASAQNYRKLREQLEQNRTLAPTPNGTAMVFARDQVFASPSAAAACVLGRTANGRLEWKIQGTQTSYSEWQESQLDSDTRGQA